MCKALKMKSIGVFIVFVTIGVIASIPTRQSISPLQNDNSVFDITCPDGTSECPDGDTCCRSNSGGYGCCSYANAVCCNDGQHCCPQGTTCDLSNGTCPSKDTIMPMIKNVPFKSGKKSASPSPLQKDNSVFDITCPDGTSECPDGDTCCRSNSGGYGCCPDANAVCCSDGQHCCPQDYSCNVSAGTCVQNVDCPDGSFCPGGNTCCPSSSGGYGCCPLVNAVCCNDGQHCCPQGTTCDLSNGTCPSKDTIMPMVKNVPFKSEKKSATTSWLKHHDAKQSIDKL